MQRRALVHILILPEVKLQKSAAQLGRYRLEICPNRRFLDIYDIDCWPAYSLSIGPNQATAIPTILVRLRKRNSFPNNGGGQDIPSCMQLGWHTL
jgi:hypothetical protein